MKQTLRLVVTLLITGMFAVAVAQGLPGASVKKEDAAAKAALAKAIAAATNAVTDVATPAAK